MNLLAIATPFFLLALLVELIVDRSKKTGYYRLSDAINSLSAGTISVTTGYFTRLIPAIILAWVLKDFALFDIDRSAFDLSPRGLFYWFVALVAFDFCYYWYHRCGHEISILWAAHAVHHQSEDYNLSTALRQTSTSFLFSWIFYVPLFLAGMPIEVYATVNALDLIYQFWVHTQHIGRLGWMEKIFVTPSNHRVHHAQNQIYIDKNYGGIFILWDRIFGSFQDELMEEPVVFGVRKPLRSWNPFWANFQVYDYLLFDARHTARWRDKFGLWFRRTGWRPADVEARFPKARSDLSRFSKFDPPVPSTIRTYVLMQFLIAVIVVLLIGQQYATHGLHAVIVPCILLWSLLFGLGALTEGREWAVKFEALRLGALLPAGYWTVLQTQNPALPAWFGAAVIAYIAASILFLLIQKYLLKQIVISDS